VATFNVVDVDLQISSVTVTPSTLRAGEGATIGWDGANTTGYPLLGEWTDAVYLSQDDQWDLADVLLATVSHTGGLEQDATYHGEADVLIPGVLAGDYHVIVRADFYNQEKEAGLEGNNVEVAGPVPLDVRLLAGDGVPDPGTLGPADRYEYYTFHLGPGENMRLSLDVDAADGASRVLVRRDAIPTHQDFHYRAGSGTPDVELTVPGTFDGGDYYLMVYTPQISGEHGYQLTGQKYEIILDDVSPSAPR
jgi:hypothetical protein